MRWNCEEHIRQKSPPTVAPNCLLTSLCMCHRAPTTHNPRDARTADIGRQFGEKRFKTLYRSGQTGYFGKFVEKSSVYLSTACRILEHRAERTERRLVSRAKKETEGQGTSEEQHQGTHGGRTRKRKDKLVQKNAYRLTQQ